MTKYISKNGNESDFNYKKIVKSITNAMKSGSGVYYPKLAAMIGDEANDKFSKKDIVRSDEIDKYILKKLNDYGQNLTASAYERYKTVKAYQNVQNPVDGEVYGIVDGSNDAVLNENSNKDGQLLSTQRDLIAGTYSRSYSERKILPTHILNAHNEGIIHIHDMDYMMHRGEINCMLINLKDMLNNGTVINGKKIEKPKSFQTACTIATQISLQVANGQYGGQTFSVSHLAPFVRISRDKWYKKYKTELGDAISEEKLNELVNKRLKEEIKAGVQTIQFQENTFSSANGQTPFVSIFMWVNEESEYRKETAMIIEEMLRQRYEGMENEFGVKVTPAFPKLLYCLDENNVPKGSEYRYLTDLAVKCSARRMNPDYISAKIMRQQYEGNVFPCMGAVSGDEVVTYRRNGDLFVESFRNMWNRLSKLYTVNGQYSSENPNKIIFTDGVEIYDPKEGFVTCYNIIKNNCDKWLNISFDRGRRIVCTYDHPFTLIDGRTVKAENLSEGDSIMVYTNQECKNNISVGFKNAWVLGAFTVNGYKSALLSGIKLYMHSKYVNDSADVVREVLENEFGKENVLVSVTQDNNEYDNSEGYCIWVKPSSNSVITTDDLYNFLFMGRTGKEYLNEIPSEVFSWSHNGRVGYLCGILDALNIKKDILLYEDAVSCRLTLNNRSFENELMALFQSCGMPAMILPYKENGNDIMVVRLKEDVYTNLKCKDKSKNVSFYSFTGDNEGYSKIVSIGKSFEKGFSYDAETVSEHFGVSGVYSHNCRSFLSPWKDKEGNYKFYGRFNRGVVTINLVDAALSSGGDEDKFWGILDERLALCKEALLIRDKRLRGASTNVSPIHWQYGAVSRLGKNDTIDSLLDGGYSSISLGYIGLYEMTKVMKGVSNTNPIGEEFAMKVMRHLEDKTKEWKDEEGLNGASLYGTPSESLCYNFCRKTEKRFGKIPGITDKDWFTNSYHVCVTEPIDAFNKLSFEAEFQMHSKGGAVSYVEVPNMENNLEALGQIVDYMYDNIQYAEINTRNGDSCGSCGFQGEMACDENGEWYCPQCGERDHNKLTVVRRTCGYIGSTFWNKGKTQEINNRVLHI